MHYSVIRQVDMSVNLPPDILSAFLRNSVSVELPQAHTRRQDGATFTIDRLIDWCNSNCTDIFYASRENPQSAKFGFYQLYDRTNFLVLLKAVANNSNMSVQ